MDKERREKMIIRRLKNILIRTAVTALLAVTVPCSVITAWAAEARIAFSDPTAAVGSEVTVTMKVTSTDGASLERASIMLSYDSTALEFVSGTNADGGAGSISVRPAADGADTKEMVSTLTFRPLKAGTSKITVNTQEIYDGDGQLATVGHQGDSTVTVTAQEGASTEAGLRSLMVSPGSLQPAFSPDVEEYQVEVGETVTRIAVSAESSNGNASVSVSGDSDLQMGDNTVTCVVTAEDGQSTKTYTIHVNKIEGGPSEPITATGDLTAVINEAQYTVAKSFDMNALPEGFEQVSYSYKGNEVMAARGTEKDLLLLYLNDEEGTGDFFIYNEGSDTWMPYMEISTTSKAVVILPVDDTVTIPDGFTEGIMNLENGRKASGWVPAGEENPQYWLFYGMNWNGEKALYRYDLEENTIQRYFQEPIGSNGAISAEQYKEVMAEQETLLHKYEIRGLMILTLGIAALILLAATVALAVKSGKGRRQTEAPGRTRRQETLETAASKEEEEDEFELIDLDLEDGTDHEAEQENDTKEDGKGTEEDDDFEFIDLDGRS